MSVPNTPQSTTDARAASVSIATGTAGSILRTGRALALLGVVLPLLLIGGLKFTQVEVEALVPLISSTPWLAWMHTVFGQAGASYVLGVVEIATVLLLIVSPWSPRAGVAGGALAALTFFVTVTLFFSLPAWDERLGGFPALSGVGQFLIKDVALLGISLTVLGESLARISTARPGPR